MAFLTLSDRSALLIEGPEAEHFLQNLITTDLPELEAGMVLPGALLQPQGKVSYPFMISRTGAEGGFRIELAADLRDNLFTRLNLYKLRAKLQIERQEILPVITAWDIDRDAVSGALADGRFPAEGRVVRLYGEADRAGLGAEKSRQDWDRLRIAHVVPEPVSDYEIGDVFPHDVLLDQLGGLSFRKGCYVGQEVVSRMHHRGSARRRFVRVHGSDALPEAGTQLMAGGKPVGTLGTAIGAEGIALIRIDRVSSALQRGEPVTADETELGFDVPERFTFALAIEVDAASGGDSASSAS